MSLVVVVIIVSRAWSGHFQALRFLHSHDIRGITSPSAFKTRLKTPPKTHVTMMSQNALSVTRQTHTHTTLATTRFLPGYVWRLQGEGHRANVEQKGRGALAWLFIDSLSDTDFPVPEDCFQISCWKPETQALNGSCGLPKRPQQHCISQPSRELAAQLWLHDCVPQEASINIWGKTERKWQKSRFCGAWLANTELETFSRVHRRANSRWDALYGDRSHVAVSEVLHGFVARRNCEPPCWLYKIT